MTQFYYAFILGKSTLDHPFRAAKLKIVKEKTYSGQLCSKVIQILSRYFENFTKLSLLYSKK